MGRNDRLLRVVVVATISTLYLTGVLSGTLGAVLLGLSGISLLTAVVGVCPLYLPFGYSTCRREK